MPLATPTEQPDGAIAAFDSFAFALGGASLGILGLGMAFGLTRWLDAPTGGRMSTVALFGVLTSLLLIMFRARLRAKRHAIVAMLAALAWVPVILAYLWGQPHAVAGQTLIDTSGFDGRWGGLIALAVTAAAIAIGLPFLGFSALLASFGRFAALDRPIVMASMGAVVAAGIASTAAVLHMRLPRESAYFASLPIVRTLHQGDALALADGSTVAYRRFWGDAGQHTCNLDGVKDWVQTQLYAPGLPPAWFVRPAHYGDECPPLAVRHDARADVWFVSVIPDGDGDAQRGFTGSEKTMRAIRFPEFARSVAPPVAWTIGGAIGAILGATLLLLGVRVEKRWAFGDAVEGRFGADGSAELPDGRRIRLPNGAAAEPGPVVLRLVDGAPQPYRGGDTDAYVKAWRKGTLGQARSAMRTEATSFYACALASALLCAAPLLWWWA